MDGQDGVADPLGMVGARLEADVHVVTAPVAVTQNIVTCANKAGIEVVQLVLEQFAAAEAVLTPDEKELGIALVDIGGGTTEVADLPPRRDRAHGGHPDRRRPLHQRPRRRAPRADHGRRAHQEEVRLARCAAPSARTRWSRSRWSAAAPRSSARGRRSRRSCSRAPRSSSAWSARTSSGSGLEKEIRSGIVLTGGGAELEGIVEVAESIFDGPVRRGVPAGVGGLIDVVSRPEWATATGLLLYGHRHKASRRRGPRDRPRDVFGFRDFFREFF